MPGMFFQYLYLKNLQQDGSLVLIELSLSLERDVRTSDFHKKAENGYIGGLNL